ncbi:hypothetical protein [Comamonas antarctica]|uniref:Uncharacterized protein n=1 Tax=Comamonas antarctica TaxID=2743470 RepID=A0A6N1X7C8_9BURK|nr:hypothetical protein [Comamonas antarctica]QKV55237.1 hypothetical protein HUK68_20060 [Comamonas antarctica]
MARHHSHHSHYLGLREGFKSLTADFKALASEIKSLIAHAQQTPAVKTAAAEVKESAGHIKQVLTGAQQDIKMVFKAAGEQIKQIFSDAGDRLAALSAAKDEPQTSDATEEAPPAAGWREAAPAVAEALAEATLTGITLGDSADPIHG